MIEAARAGQSHKKQKRRKMDFYALEMRDPEFGHLVDKWRNERNPEIKTKLEAQVNSYFEAVHQKKAPPEREGGWQLCQMPGMMLAT